jgi:hypothetical protein
MVISEVRQRDVGPETSTGSDSKISIHSVHSTGYCGDTLRTASLWLHVFDASLLVDLRLGQR